MSFEHILVFVLGRGSRHGHIVALGRLSRLQYGLGSIVNEGSKWCEELGGNQFLGLQRGLGYLDVCWVAAHQSIEAVVIVRRVVDGAQVAIGVDERVLAHDLVVLARLLLALDVARVRIIDQPVELVCHRARVQVWPQLNGPDGDAAQRQAKAEQIAELKDSE